MVCPLFCSSDPVFGCSELTTIITARLQMTLRELGGILALVPLLDSTDVYIRLGSISILSAITLHPVNQIEFGTYDNLKTLVKAISDLNTEVKAAALSTLNNVCEHNVHNRHVIIRESDAIATLGRQLRDKSDAGAVRGLQVTACWFLSQCQGGREQFFEAGMLPILVAMLNTTEEGVDVASVVGFLANLAKLKGSLAHVEKTDILQHVTKLLKTGESTILQRECCNFIASFVKGARGGPEAVKNVKCLDIIFELGLLKSPDMSLIIAATKCVAAIAVGDVENAKAVNANGGMKLLVNLVIAGKLPVQQEATAALTQCILAHDFLSQAVRGAGGVDVLIGLLTHSDYEFLAAVCGCLAALGHNPDNVKAMLAKDAMRLLWTLLKHENDNVKSKAVYALSYLFVDPDNCPAARSFVGGLQMLVHLLHSPSIPVQAAACLTIARVAQDSQNQAVMNELDLVQLISRLVSTSDSNLRFGVCLAVAALCPASNNRVLFGEYGVLMPIVRYLLDSDKRVHRAAAIALRQLSEIPRHGLVLREAGAVALLLELLDTKDYELQEAAAATIANIRRSHLAAAEGQL
jgi:HEAT repeat protein